MAASSSSDRRGELPPAPFRPELGLQRYRAPFTYEHDYASAVAASESLCHLVEVLEECTEFGINLVRDMEELMYDNNLISPGEKGGIVQLETALLQAGGCANLLQGLFYMLPLYQDGKLFVRYMERGSYKGFLQNIMPQLKKHYRVVDSNILPWKVFTEKDFQLESTASSSKDIGKVLSKMYGRKVGSNDPKRSNKSCIMALIDQMKTKLEETGIVVFVHKARANNNVPQHRFLYCSPMWKEGTISIDKLLTDFVVEAVGEEEVTSNISHISQYPYSSKKQQFLLLSSISNYHWYKWKGAHDKHSHVRYSDHLLYHPDEELIESGPLEGSIGRKYIPSSPRNKVMYYVSMQVNAKEEKSISGLYESIKILLQSDHPREEEVQGDTNDIPEEVIQQPRKKRKHAARLVTATAKMISQEVGEDLETVLNSADKHRTLYTKFREELVTDGIIRWRLHEHDRDICVMTDINPSTGALVPTAFAHVSCRKASTGELLLKCSCTIYNLIQRAAHQEVKIWPEEVLDDQLTCMHCRFFREHLVDAYANLTRQNTALSRVLTTVQQSLQYMNDPIQLLGGVYPSSTTKFSVKGMDDYSLIHLSFVHGKCYVKCMEGLCAAKMLNRKRVPHTTTISMKDERSICPHLQTIYKQLDYVKSFFPGYFSDENEVHVEGEPESIPNMAVPDEFNNEDANAVGEIYGNFNLATGLWEYKAHSKHKPHEMMDPQLIKETQKRNDVIKSDNLDSDTGLYGPYYLIASTVDPSGNPKMCQCGSGFPADTDGNRVAKGTSKLYTRMGIIVCNNFDVLCTGGNCVMPYLDEAKHRGIFFYSTYTCIGEEVGWDFVNRVMKTKTSFTAFCKDMSRIYETTNILSAPFMTTPTFVSWFFGWLAAFKIDFRKEVDPWCSHTPKILACDGTHIGVSLRNMQLEKPVTRPDVDTILKPLHKRYDRVLIDDRASHHHLRYLTSKHLGKLKPDKVIPVEEEHRRTIEMTTKLHNLQHDSLTAFILTYVQRTQDDEVIYCMGRLLHMLSGDACMSSVAPFPCHDLIRFCCIHIDERHLIEEALEEIRRYNVEISKLLKLSRIHECTDTVTGFLIYLVEKIEAVHQNNRPAPQPVPVPNSYDPRSGTAYYFTPHGNRLRSMPAYNITGGKKEGMYDTYPEVGQACRKIFPEVSFGGFGYLFLWFCPIHGHSYGMHLIAGGEGRKDPFASLFKYIEKAPEHIFYDFACNLSEYCLNREPEFFRNTRFWHDLFHAITHVCGLNFKSGRVEGLQGINTEICEQINAFLQCVKYTASHLSQDHFMFFLQFFLHMMNKEKTQKFRKQASIAVAGQL